MVLYYLWKPAIFVYSTTTYKFKDKKKLIVTIFEILLLNPGLFLTIHVESALGLIEIRDEYLLINLEIQPPKNIYDCGQHHLASIQLSISDTNFKNKINKNNLQKIILILQNGEK